MDRYTFLAPESWPDPDAGPNPVVAFRVTHSQGETENPTHTHRSGQLILALDGAVSCETPGFLWMVPPGCAVWIPGGLPHSCRATANARVCFLFVRPGAARLPDECRTLEISALVREMILHLAASQSLRAEPADAHRLSLMRSLLGELERMPPASFRLPLPAHPGLRQIAEAWLSNPAERGTLLQWAGRLAMSERTLARLVVQETRMSFGRWRQQWHLLEALRQLAAGARVQQVADALGYGSATAFIAMFKKAAGVTPLRYFGRRAVRSGENLPAED